ncbi:hypothetical protein D3C59_34015 [Streptomyces sp. SHP22-7]|nr:hypothetical protein D3C59_34015 [Streptomyces sp. SHP22-7]
MICALALLATSMISSSPRPVFPATSWIPVVFVEIAAMIATRADSCSRVRAFSAFLDAVFALDALPLSLTAAAARS